MTDHSAERTTPPNVDALLGALEPGYTAEPTEAGWYSQSGTSGHMIYARSRAGDWYAFTVEGWSTPCDWGYIDQAGPVVKVVLP